MGPQNVYTSLKLGSKTHFYGRVAAEVVLAIAYEYGPFMAAERLKRVLVPKRTFTNP